MERKEMKKRLFAGLLATALLGAIHIIPAEASCTDRGDCPSFSKTIKKHAVRNTKTKHVSSARTTKKYALKSKSRKYASRKSSRHARRGQALATVADGGHVVALIKAMAPAHGVPTWFALRIAKVESNYNPRARGSAGELGVFQLKCATAKGIGYSGSCNGLLDARINVNYGLKHLSLAMKSSRGNLRLAASKHNGGLGRKTEVHGYVAKIF
jgi:soluble lytic murein transglycosylase-like protein